MGNSLSGVAFGPSKEKFEPVHRMVEVDQVPLAPRAKSAPIQFGSIRLDIRVLSLTRLDGMANAWLAWLILDTHSIHFVKARLAHC